MNRPLITAISWFACSSATFAQPPAASAEAGTAEIATRPAPQRGACPPPPGIVNHPTAVTSCSAGPAVFTTTASGFATPFSYQWQVLRGANWINLPTGTYSEGVGALSMQCAGSTTSSLTVGTIQLGSHAPAIQLRCRVTDTCLQPVTTNPATLTVCRVDVDCNHVVSPADIGVFVTLWLDSLTAGTLAADFDGNGAVNSADVGGFVSAWFSALAAGC